MDSRQNCKYTESRKNSERIRFWPKKYCWLRIIVKLLMALLQDWLYSIIALLSIKTSQLQKTWKSSLLTTDHQNKTLLSYKMMGRSTPVFCKETNIYTFISAWTLIVTSHYKRRCVVRSITNWAKRTVGKPESKEIWETTSSKHTEWTMNETG